MPGARNIRTNRAKRIIRIEQALLGYDGRSGLVGEVRTLRQELRDDREHDKERRRLIHVRIDAVEQTANHAAEQARNANRWSKFVGGTGVGGGGVLGILAAIRGFFVG